MAHPNPGYFQDFPMVFHPHFKNLLFLGISGILGWLQGIPTEKFRGNFGSSQNKEEIPLKTGR